MTSFTPILQLIFITLKLTGHITWSWWWVFTPVYVVIFSTLLLSIYSVISSEKRGGNNGKNN